MTTTLRTAAPTALLVALLVLGAAPVRALPTPKVLSVDVDTGDDAVEVVVALDRPCEVRRSVSDKGALLFDFPGLRLPRGSHKERPDCILVYSVHLAQLRSGFRVILNRKQFLPAAGTTLEAGWDTEKPATYRIRYASRLAALAPPREGVTTLLIDPGHGGLDPGNLGKDVHEKVVTLAVARKLEALVNAMPGWRALMTRSGDVYVPVEDRPKLGRIWGVDLLVSLHCNAFRGDQKVVGFEVLRLSEKGYNSIAPHLEPDVKTVFDGVMVDSFRLAQSVRDCLAEGTDLKDRGVKRDEMIVTRTARHPSILVELGFLSDEDEAKKLTDPAFQGKVAEAVRKGLLLYMDRKKTGWTGPARPNRPPRPSRPRPAPVVASAPEGGHVVAKGDTLGRIARRYGVTVSSLVSANRLVNPDQIAVGQRLTIPEAEAPQAPLPSSASSPPTTAPPSRTE